MSTKGRNLGVFQAVVTGFAAGMVCDYRDMRTSFWIWTDLTSCTITSIAVRRRQAFGRATSIMLESWSALYLPLLRLPLMASLGEEVQSTAS